MIDFVRLSTHRLEPRARHLASDRRPPRRPLDRLACSAVAQRLSGQERDCLVPDVHFPITLRRKCEWQSDPVQPSADRGARFGFFATRVGLHDLSIQVRTARGYVNVCYLETCPIIWLTCDALFQGGSAVQAARAFSAACARPVRSKPAAASAVTASRA